MLRTPAHEGARAAGFMALSMQACGRASSVQTCRAGTVMEKPLPVNQRARPPGSAVGDKLEDLSR